MSGAAVKIAVTADTRDAVSGFDKVGDAAEDSGRHFDDAAEHAGNMASTSSQLAGGMGDLGGALSALPGPLGGLGTAMEGSQFAIMGVTGAADLAEVAMNKGGIAAKAFGIAMQVATGPIGLLILAIAALVVGLVIAYKHSETFRNIVNAAFGAVRDLAVTVFGKITDAVRGTFEWIKDHWKLVLSILTGPIGAAVIQIATHWDKIKTGAENMKQAVKEKMDDLIGFVKAIPGKVSGLASDLKQAGKDFIGGLWDGILTAAKSAGGFVGSLVDAIKTAINNTLHLPLKIDFDKGPLHIHETLIPALADGGIVTRPTLALIGEEGPEAVVPLRGRRSFGNLYQIVVQIAPGGDLVEAGRQITTAIDAYERAGGRRGS